MFKRNAKILVAIVLAPIFLGLIAVFLNPKLFPNPCKNQIVNIYTSPDKQFDVILFQRDCGATTGFSSQVSVIESGSELPNKSGNIFIADEGDTPVSLGSWGGPLVKVKWTARDKVTIEYPNASRVFLNESRYKGIQIEYRAR